MKALKLLATIAIAMSMGYTSNAVAAKLMYTTPVWTHAGVADGASRISCDALNLDKRIQTVRAEIINHYGDVVADKTVDIIPGFVENVSSWYLETANDFHFCRFTIKTTKVRPFVTVYNRDLHTQFVMDAK